MLNSHKIRRRPAPTRFESVSTKSTSLVSEIVSLPETSVDLNLTDPDDERVITGKAEQ